MQTKISFGCVLIICLSCFGNDIFAACNKNGKTAGFDQYSDGQYSYECNVENLCLGKKFGGDGWNFNTSKQLIKQHDKTKYPDLEKTSKSFAEIQKIYQTTQDDIFECAVLKSKYAAHSQIIKDYTPSKTSVTYLQKLNTEIKRQIKENKCLSAGDDDKVYNYKDLLDSTSYEECVYTMYLYYYEEKASNNIGIFYGNAEGAKKIIDISNDLGTIRTTLANEHEISAKSLSSALESYDNFHANYTPHMMLETTYQELTQDKTMMAKIAHGIKQLISLFTGAQKQA